ncbi:hypothetical protein CYMTET_6179 [Cymbomonas tetramitiformis]|uniref:Helicase ATP-binding domain-containing protein n=1 Tax=Cymbomonas tetramitiformis TaxID=36881 RepID=A0AAE0LIR6_9CHLO|nr:hypothetical protein CYMTET_6179 [Cymbomonas tetramitiformis]
MAKLKRFVVDEAHCVSEFGADFRKAYARLGELRDRFPDVPFTAVTGTATDKTKSDIKVLLKLKKPMEFCTNSHRPNLYLAEEVESKTCLTNSQRKLVVE